VARAALRSFTRFRESGRTIGPIASVILISEGKGNLADRNYYPAPTLQRAVADGLFEGAQSYFDHPTRTEDREQPERSVRQLAGYFSNAKIATIGGLISVVASFSPQAGNQRVLELLRTSISYAREFPNGSYVGLSINAIGSGSSVEIDGQTWNRVDRFESVQSVDFVTRAGARGRILSLQESFRMAAPACGMRIRERATTKRIAPPDWR